MGNSDIKTEDWLPAALNTAQGKTRRVGVEIEFAGVPIDTVAECIQRLYGGHITPHTPIEYTVNATRFGDFKLELDASLLKSRMEKQVAEDAAGENLSTAMLSLVTAAAEQFVPWEVVAPPIAFNELQALQALYKALRELGALGTRHALHYAFGLHLNPELPDLEAATILSYLRAYLCLYDYIAHREQVDTARRITPFINHFEKDYIERVLDPAYQPSLTQLIDDYLAFNPSRNRSLDLLPLFAHLDEERVRAVIDDPNIKARPTFHYRLPNSDIDNPEWNVYFPWSLWLEVEKLALDSDRLEHIASLYRKELGRLTHPIERRWLRQITDLITER